MGYSGIGSSVTTATGVTVSTVGDNTIYTPTAGFRIRVYYISMSADSGNGAAVTAIVKFGASGATLYKVSLTPKAIWARNVGAGRNWIEGLVNEAVIVNLSAGQQVHVSIEYDETR